MVHGKEKHPRWRALIFQAGIFDTFAEFEEFFRKGGGVDRVVAGNVVEGVAEEREADALPLVVFADLDGFDPALPCPEVVGEIMDVADFITGVGVDSDGGVRIGNIEAVWEHFADEGDEGVV